MGCYSFKKLKKLQIFGQEAYKKTKATSGTPLAKCITEAFENNYKIIVGIQKTRINIICRKGNEKQWKPDEKKKLDPNINAKKMSGPRKPSLSTRKAKIQVKKLIFS